MRRNDECYPRPERGSGYKGTQNENAYTEQTRLLLDVFAAIESSCKLVNKFVQWENFKKAYEIVRKIGGYDVGVYRKNVVDLDMGKTPKKPTMSSTAPVLPSSDELDRLDEVKQHLKDYPHLERCLSASSSVSAGFHEFYLDLAQKEGKELSVVLFEAARSIKSVIDAFNTLSRLEPRTKKISGWIEKLLESRKWDELCSKEDCSARNRTLRKLTRIQAKLFKMIVGAYEAMDTVISNHWNYLPVELQEALESLSRRIILAKPEIEGANDELLTENVSKLLDTLMRLAASVFEAVESNRDYPKLHLLKLFQGWNLEHAVSQEGSTASSAMSEIQELVENLVELAGVELAMAVAHVPGDLHRVTFYLKISTELEIETGFDDEEDIWEVAERMALRAHRRLRNLTEEKWYFHVALNDNFSDYPNSSNVVAFAHAESNNPHSTS